MNGGMGLLALILLAAPASETVIFHEPFDGRLAAGWRWLREDNQAWRIRDGSLQIRVQPGDANTVRNGLLRPAPDRSSGRYAIEVTVKNLSPPMRQWEQLGLTWYQDGRPVLKVVKELVDGKILIVPGMVPIENQAMQLRLLIDAESFEAQYRRAGSAEWNSAEKGKLPRKGKEEISIQCYHGPDAAEHWMQFDDFRIIKLD